METYRMNRDAMSIPSERLLDSLRERIEWKRGVLEERDKVYGKDRPQLQSYMENLALPELFGFDMNDLLSDAHLAVEIEFRHRIFWVDNSVDDSVPWTDLGATAGMYYDMTLFGEEVRHCPQGVPEFRPHPIAENPDLSIIKPFDFHQTGAMPGLIRKYHAMKEIAQTQYGGQFGIWFPSFGRGPLDIYIQLRGYENFATDTVERPEFVHQFLTHIVNERARFNRERREFLGEEAPESPTTGIDDDWVNVPFISPGIFREFVLPAYRLIQENEGTVNHFHTCGDIMPIVEELLEVFPGIETLDVSGWNDPEELDRMLDPAIAFRLSFINSFVLSGNEQAHREKLSRIAPITRNRTVSLCAQAIVRLHDDFEEDLRRMNRFISLAREMLSQKELPPEGQIARL